MFSKFVLPALAAMLLSVSASQAATVVFNGPANLKGTGNGTVVGILSLQAKPADNGQEWGWTGFNGTTQTRTFSASNSQNKTGNGNATYQALSPADLASIGFNNLNTFLSNFAVIFQIGEGNGSLTLQQLNVSFYSGTTNSDMLDAFFPGPGSNNTTNKVLTGVGQGTSGYDFTLANLTANDLVILNNWWNSGGYVGLTVSANYPILSANAAADNFFVANQNNQTVTATPGTPLPAGFAARQV